MRAPELIAGPYRPPQCRPGDWLDDEIDGKLEVGGWTTAPMPWPRRKKTGRPSLILTAELARAVRTESVAAICHWWGVRPTKVWMWRKALGVETTEGSRRIARRGVPPEAAARGRKRATEPGARAKIAEAKRGRPVPPQTRAALLRSAMRPKTTMTPEDLKQWRYHMDLIAPDAAEVLGISTTMVRWYETSRRNIPHYIALACSAVYAGEDDLLPASMQEWRKQRGWSQSRLSLALGFVGSPNGIWEMEKREQAGIPLKRAHYLALLALEKGLLPWHRLRRRLNLRTLPPFRAASKITHD